MLASTCEQPNRTAESNSQIEQPNRTAESNSRIDQPNRTAKPETVDGGWHLLEPEPSNRTAESNRRVEPKTRGSGTNDQGSGAAEGAARAASVWRCCAYVMTQVANTMPKSTAPKYRLVLPSMCSCQRQPSASQAPARHQPGGISNLRISHVLKERTQRRNGGRVACIGALHRLVGYDNALLLSCGNIYIAVYCIYEFIDFIAGRQRVAARCI